MVDPYCQFYLQYQLFISVIFIFQRKGNKFNYNHVLLGVIYIIRLFSHWYPPRPKEHYTPAHKDYKYILTWSNGIGPNISDPHFYGLTSGFSGFQQCPEPRCYLTSNRELLGDRVIHICFGKYSLIVSCFILGLNLVHDFDAILFHQRTLNTTDLPPKSNRRSEQRYVHFSMESPLYAFYDLTDLKYLNKYFNWSMSYRLDADFPVPYGQITKVSIYA